MEDDDTVVVPLSLLRLLAAGLTMLATRLVDRACGALFRFTFGYTAVFVRVLDVLVLSVAFAAFLHSAWHWMASLRDEKESRTVMQ